jgi:hypothetical protein
MNSEETGCGQAVVTLRVLASTPCTTRGRDRMVSYGAAWMTLALVNAVLAQSKGRSGLMWWALSLALGPVATLFIALGDRPAKEEL